MAVELQNFKRGPFGVHCLWVKYTTASGKKDHRYATTGDIAELRKQGWQIRDRAHGGPGCGPDIPDGSNDNGGQSDSGGATMAMKPDATKNKVTALAATVQEQGNLIDQLKDVASTLLNNDAAITKDVKDVTDASAKQTDWTKYALIAGGLFLLWKFLK